MRDWWQPRLTLRTALLLPLSLLFGALAALRRALYRAGILSTQRLPVPVLVVGNLTVGGSGKTPLVIALAQAFTERGWHPGVISRGYGAEVDGAREVHADSSPAQVGDEPLLIRRSGVGCPVFVGRKRVEAGHALLAAYPRTNLIISDDGLQHYALARDAEVAVFDARGAGNGRLLPAGPLREPLARAATLDAVVCNGEVPLTLARPAWRMDLRPWGLFLLVDPAQRRDAADLAREYGSRIAALAGIGSPERFFTTLRGLGLQFEEHPFPDHHAYTAADLKAITAPLIVMTEKDAIKCAQFGDPRIWVLPVTAQIDPGLVDALLEKLRGSQTA
ncbi:MAG TPA: tetraacyldisaccharide 4'-kinase [Burkholderiales bacterium]|jgi:tetraacyldisaccharide 4'-kinase|nr:tetraacyldisaccharide 4'-kinase [Burkholderiales bacterium]